MKTLKPIGIENQIVDVLEGESAEQRNAVLRKIEQCKKDVAKITHINGSKVYAVIVNGEKLEYMLTPTPEFITELVGDNFERKYYYPIQYAEITFAP